MESSYSKAAKSIWEGIADVDKLSIQSDVDRSLRLKVTAACTWDCKFCHKEGGWKDVETFTWDKSAEIAFEQLYKAGFDEVHFTGGEPSLNPHLPDLIRGLKLIGYKVKMTSILGGKTSSLSKIAQSGISGINISLHTDPTPINPEAGFVPEECIEEVSQLQIGKTRAQVKKQLLALAQGLDIFRNANIPIKSNTVISSPNDIPKIKRIFEYAKTKGLSFRLLPSLSSNDTESPFLAIREFLRQIKATPRTIKVTKGNADMTIIFVDKDGYEFGVKLIADVLLTSMCVNCELKGTTKCREKYYGIRIERRKIHEEGKSEFYVRLCIDNESEDTLMDIDQFFGSAQFQEIVAFMR